jgi:hypothetical protein
MNQKRTRMTSHPVTLMRRRGWRMQNSKMRMISRRLRQDPAATASEQSELFVTVQDLYDLFEPMQQASVSMQA